MCIRRFNYYIFNISSNFPIMKILTEKEQLRAKLNELDDVIKYSENEVKRVLMRQERKKNWGIFLFILDGFWLLNYEFKTKSTQLNLLKEYKEVISDMLLKN